MKKKLIITLASLMAVTTGAAAIGGATYSASYAEEANVTTYLVLSSVGMYNGSKGENFSDLYLENTIKFEAKPGTELPRKEAITAPGTSGEFDHWEAYEGTGFPTVYKTVPNETKILYAFYKNTNVDPGPGPGPGPGPVGEEKTYYLNAGIWDIDGAWFAAWIWKSGGEGKFVKLDSAGSGYYKFDINTNSYDSVIFTRMESGKTDMSWGNVWNKTNDLTLGTSNCYSITAWGGEGQPSIGSWGTYSA